MGLKLTPEEKLWLAIMERDDRLRGMVERKVRAHLRAAGFPARLIDEYLERRKAEG